MSQRRADFIQSCFGEQSLTALQAQLCEQLPLGCFGTKVNAPAAWQLLCYASVRRTTIEQTVRTLADVPSAVNNPPNFPSFDRLKFPTSRHFQLNHFIRYWVSPAALPADSAVKGSLRVSSPALRFSLSL